MLLLTLHITPLFSKRVESKALRGRGEGRGLRDVQRQRRGRGGRPGPGGVAASARDAAGKLWPLWGANEEANHFLGLILRYMTIRFLAGMFFWDL